MDENQGVAVGRDLSPALWDYILDRGCVVDIDAKVPVSGDDAEKEYFNTHYLFVANDGKLYANGVYSRVGASGGEVFDDSAVDVEFNPEFLTAFLGTDRGREFAAGLSSASSESEGEAVLGPSVQAAPAPAVADGEAAVYAPVVDFDDMDDLLEGSSVEPEVYGIAYDRARTFMEDVLVKMGREVGWKGEAPFDFTGFDGYYPELTDNGIDICRGTDTLATFYPEPDGSLGFDQYGEGLGYEPDVNAWYPLTDIMNGKFCLERENVDLARRQLHGGHILIYGLEFGDAVAFGVDPGDRLLRTKLAETGANVRFVRPADVRAAVDRWIDTQSRPGFEQEERPRLVFYTYDGLDVRSEKDLAVGADRVPRGEYGSDWELIEVIRDEGERIRRDLESAAGIPETSTRFKFSTAVFPYAGIRDDALFLSSDCGRSMGDFITVAQGRVALYREYDPQGKLSKPVRVFPSAKAAMSLVRNAVLSRENVELARGDYLAYLQSQSRSHGVSR